MFRVGGAYKFCKCYQTIMLGLPELPGQVGEHERLIRLGKIYRGSDGDNPVSQSFPSHCIFVGFWYPP